MNILGNKNISAFIINADGLICRVPSDKNTQNPLIHAAHNQRLAQAIDNILYHGFKVVWISNNAADDVKNVIRTVLGNSHEKTSVIGHELATAKYDPCLYERLIFEALEKRDIAPDEAILISNNEFYINSLSSRKVLYATLIANSSEELAECLEKINFCYLLN